MKTLLTLLMFATLAASAAENPATDRWGRVRFLLGTWEGTAAGQPGNGTVQRPEIHHHRGFISNDWRAREG